MDTPSPRVDAPRILAELDAPTGVRDGVLRNFAAAADHLALLVEGSRRRADAVHGHQVFAIVHLLTRGLSDLIAGAHLLSHCFVTQAYSVMRPALDAADLIELFSDRPAEAELWATTTNAHKDFSPAAVRRKLGEPPYDPVHGHFSESGTHPRFAGARLHTWMRGSADDSDGTGRVIVPRIGPAFPEDPGSLFAWLFACNALSLLAFKAHHLERVTTVTSERWLDAYEAVLLCLREAVALISDELGEPEVAELFDEGLDQVRAIREDE